MTQLPWKRHLALSALVLAPVLAGPATALAAPQSPATASEENVHKATSFFTKGAELFKAKKYPQALDEFKQSYALLSSPNTHLYIARCLAAMGDTRGAWLEYDRTAAEAQTAGPKYEKVPGVALQERDDLAPKPALVTVMVQGSDPAMTVSVGTTSVPPDRWGKPYPVTPGTYDVVVQAPGKPPVKQSVTVGPGGQAEAHIDLAAAAAPPPPVEQPAAGHGMSPMRIGAFIGFGVGVVGFAMLAGGGAASKGTYNDINTICGGKAGCPSPVGATRADVDSKISSGKTQQAVANAGLALGVIGVAAGATLFVLSLRKTPGDQAKPAAMGETPKPPPRASADLVVKPSWAGVEGRF